jgi:hypothetical protein
MCTDTGIPIAEPSDVPVGVCTVEECAPPSYCYNDECVVAETPVVETPVEPETTTTSGFNMMYVYGAVGIAAVVLLLK